VRATLSEGDCETLCRGVDAIPVLGCRIGAVLDEELCEVNISRTRLRQLMQRSLPILILGCHIGNRAR